MKVEQPLLELLADELGCHFLSDLRFLSPARRQHLAQLLERIQPREEDIREWNEALAYLTGAPPENTAYTAQRQLIRLLSGHHGLLPKENRTWE